MLPRPHNILAVDVVVFVYTCHSRGASPPPACRRKSQAALRRRAATCPPGPESLGAASGLEAGCTRQPRPWGSPGCNRPSSGPAPPLSLSGPQAAPAQTWPFSSSPNPRRMSQSFGVTGFGGRGSLLTPSRRKLFSFHSHASVLGFREIRMDRPHSTHSLYTVTEANLEGDTRSIVRGS